MNFDDIDPFIPNKLPTWQEFIKENPDAEKHLANCRACIFMHLRAEAMSDDINHVASGRIKIDDLRKKYCE